MFNRFSKKSNIRFGNGKSARQQYEDAILAASEFAYKLSDIDVKASLINELRSLLQVKSSDTNYEKWAKLLKHNLENSPQYLFVCFSQIRQEAANP